MSKEILATVAGNEITQEDFDAFCQALPQEQKAYLQNPAAKEYYLNQFIGLYLFAELGKEEKMDETAEFKEFIANATRDIIAQLAIRKFMEDVTVSDEEIKAFYEENKHQFQTSETVNAKHILMESEDEIKDVQGKIESGEITFEDAAKAHSTCPSKEAGGSLGEFGRGQMVKEFEDAAFAADLEKVVGPVKTQFGYHLIKVESKKEAATQEFDAVKETIRMQLMQQKQQKAYDEKIKELKEKYC